MEQIVTAEQDAMATMPAALEVSCRNRQRADFRRFLENGGCVIDATPHEITGEDWAGTRFYQPKGGLAAEDYFGLRELLTPIERDIVARAVMEAILDHRKVPRFKQKLILDGWDWAVQPFDAPLAERLEQFGFAAVAEAVVGSVPRPTTRCSAPVVSQTFTHGAPADNCLAQVLALTCAIAQAHGACRAEGGPPRDLPLLIPADVARKWKVTPPSPPKKRGAPQRYDRTEDRKLCEQWRMAKGYGQTLKEFARQIGRSHTEINRALGREQKRRRKRKPDADQTLCQYE